MDREEEIRCAYYTLSFFICQPLFEYFFHFLKIFLFFPSFSIQKGAFFASFWHPPSFLSVFWWIFMQSYAFFMHICIHPRFLCNFNRKSHFYSSISPKCTSFFVYFQQLKFHFFIEKSVFFVVLVSLIRKKCDSFDCFCCIFHFFAFFVYYIDNKWRKWIYSWKCQSFIV